MNGTMHIGDINAQQVNIFIPILTRVKYTSTSGLPDWEGRIENPLEGTGNSWGNCTSSTPKIPNVRQAETLSIGTDVTIIGNYAFGDCSQLKTVTIPDSVTAINYRAFMGCTGITELNIGKNVTSIGLAAFIDNTSLTFVTIPNSVVSIEGGAFQHCTNLIGITLSENITTLEGNTLKDCTKLESVSIPGKVQTLVGTPGSGTFYNCSKCKLFDFRRLTSVPTLDHVSVFYNTPSDKEIIVPDSLYDSWITAPNWSSTTNNIVNCIVKASQSSLGTL